MLFLQTLVVATAVVLSNPILVPHNPVLQLQDQDSSSSALNLDDNAPNLSKTNQDSSSSYVPKTVKERLIKTSEDEEAVLMSESDIFGLYQSNTKFIDVTDGDYDLIQELASSRKVSSSSPFPADVSHEEVTKELIEKIDTKRMEKWITSLTKFHTRYYKSKTGKDSANWIFNEIQSLSKHTADGVELTVEKFEHSWGQFSIIAKYHASTSSKSDAEIVILSAHQDSVNQWNPWFGRSPGADDNGSGSTTIFETLSILVESGYIPEKRHLEFHWYSAEEGGLLGSQKVVASYLQKKKPVFAVLHSDMTGYQPDGLDPIVGIATDFVSKDLSDTLVKVTEAYSEVGWKYTKCGYGCSDHASWTKGGIPSAFTFEALFENSSPFIHSTEDTVKHISIEHMSSFVKVVLGFLVEVGLA